MITIVHNIRFIWLAKSQVVLVFLLLLSFLYALLRLPHTLIYDHFRNRFRAGLCTFCSCFQSVNECLSTPLQLISRIMTCLWWRRQIGPNVRSALTCVCVDRFCLTWQNLFAVNIHALLNYRSCQWYTEMNTFMNLCRNVWKSETLQICGSALLNKWVFGTITGGN